MKYFELLLPLIAKGDAVYFVYNLSQQRVTYVSEAYEQLTGSSTLEVNNDLPRRLSSLHPDDRQYFRHLIEKTVPGEIIPAVELRTAREEESTRWLRITACLTADQDGAPCVSGRLEDITRDKHALINAQKFNTKKDATLEILSHDLASPLATLQQLTEQVNSELGEQASPQLQLLLNLMERTCIDGTNLIRDFVDNEFMESASVELKLERTDLAKWLSTIMTEYQSSTWHTHVNFVYTPFQTPLYVILDVNKFQQVINNLVSNALKFTPDGGTISITLEQRGTEAVVTVADTGVGIPAAVQPVLFDKFTKARRPGIRGEKSNGLGMSIIQTIVDLHRGHITFESQEGQGTVFTIRIPTLNLL